MLDEQNKDLIYEILYSANWLEGNIRDLLKPHGITVQQYHILKIIDDSDELVNHTVLKKKVIEKDADISRMVNRLLNLNLITKSAVSGDKRQSRLRLSKKGQGLMDNLSEIPFKTNRLFDHLTEEEMDQMKALLHKTYSEF